MNTKAYTCTESCEGTGGIVFAKSNIEARKSAASIWGDGDLAGWRIYRSPGLDKYRNSDVPTQVLIEDGWFFECHGCGMKMDETSLADELLPVSGVVGKQNGRSFCSHQCRMDHSARTAAAKAYGEAFLDMMKEGLAKRFAGAELSFGEHRHHVYVHSWDSPLVVQQARVGFSYPGAKLGSAHLCYDKNGPNNYDEVSCGRWYYSVPFGDVKTYEAWAADFPRLGYI